MEKLFLASLAEFSFGVDVLKPELANFVTEMLSSFDPELFLGLPFVDGFGFDFELEFRLAL